MEPITTELRKLMAHTVDGFDLNRPLVECDRAEFERLCGQIDAVHESLERENDRLKVELDCVLGELDDMHKSGEISNKSGGFMQNYVALPVDADGVPIRVGDVLESEYESGTYVRKVMALILTDRWDYEMDNDDPEDGDSRCVADMSDFYRCTRHYHAPTVEDVLREFANEVYADADNEIRDRDFLCAKYAKRLKLAEGEDE